MDRGRKKPNFSVENSLRKKGALRICGIDEAGRGSWAGPIVSAAVILNPKNKIVGIDDSKRINKKLRKELCQKIKDRAISYGVGMASVKEINKYGIQPATYLSYIRAIEKISPPPDFIIIDHYRLPNSPFPQLSITFGDQISLSIAAASIVAKVERDDYMTKLSKIEPGYYLEKNFGYGTKVHQGCILELGLSNSHRKKFVEKLYKRKSQEKIFDN